MTTNFIFKKNICVQVVTGAQSLQHNSALVCVDFCKQHVQTHFKTLLTLDITKWLLQKGRKTRKGYKTCI